MFSNRFILAVLSLVVIISTAQAVNVSLTPITQEVQTGQYFTVGVNIDSGTDKIQCAQIDITYPAANMTALTNTYGTNQLLSAYVIIFPNTISSGTISYGACRTTDPANATAVNGLFFTIQFYPSTTNTGLANINIASTILLNDTSTPLAGTNTTNASVNVSYFSTSSSSTVFKTLPHNVKFIVRNVYGTNYPNVTVTATGYSTTVGSWNILGSLLGLDFAVTPIANQTMSGVTGSDGSIPFMMIDTVYYYITAVGTNPTINESYWLYPTETTYYLTVSTTSNEWNQYAVPLNEAVITTVNKGIIDTPTAWVNVTYNDSLAQTTSLKIYINQSNATMNGTQITVNSWTCAALCNSTYHNFTISNYNGQSYIVTIIATHVTYGTIKRSYAVVFTKTMSVEGIPDITWLYISILLMVFTGAIFTYSTSELGLLIVCGEGWLFYLFGWFASTNVNMVAIGLTLTTFMAIVAYIAKQGAKGVGS